jgi:hypothetical protein
MLTPFCMLCIDLFFSSIEYIFFLDVNLKVAFFENLHLFFEYSDEVIELCHLLFHLDKKLLNFFHGNHVSRSNLHLNSLIFLLKLLEEIKWHWFLLLEIDLHPLNISLHLLNITCIYLHNSNYTRFDLFFKFGGKFLAFMSIQRM